VDGLPDEEIMAMVAAAGSNIDLDDAREHLWDETYNEVREDFELDPLGWLRKEGWDVDRGKLPRHISIDYLETAQSLVETHGVSKFIDHDGGRGLRLQSAAVFGRDYRVPKGKL